jgi:beta-lactam-binding protein with PASTA domain
VWVGHEVNPVPAGTVFAQSPTAPGQVAFERDTANSSVSLGAVTVPDVVTWSRTAAMNILSAVGLMPTYSITSSNLTHDDVLTESPAGGTVVQRGCVVHLTVASGPSGGGGNNPP